MIAVEVSLGPGAGGSAHRRPPCWVMPKQPGAVGHLGRVRLLDPPHSGANYLTTEMYYRVARKHARKLRRIAFIAGIAVPFGLTVNAMLSTGALPAIAATLAVVSAALGVLIERWLFFAEAKHVMSLYYGAPDA